LAAQLISTTAAHQLDLPVPEGSGAFGDEVKVLQTATSSSPIQNAAFLVAHEKLGRFICMTPKHFRAGSHGDDEVSHVPQDKVSFSHDIDEVFANFLVLLRSVVEEILHAGATDEIKSKVDPEEGGFAPPVAVAGAVIGVEMVDSMSGGVLNQIAIEALAQRV